MNKTLMYIGILGIFFTFPACTSLQSFSYDRLQAADVSFPEQVRSVGVVNAIPAMMEEKGNVDFSMMEGDGKVASELLAQEIAAAEYFDEVVIADSTLSLPLSWSQKEVARVVQAMDVDVLFVLERLPIQLSECKIIDPEWMSEMTGIEGRLTSLIKVYAEGRNQPLFVVNKADTLNWPVTSSLTYGQIRKEASEYAAFMFSEHILPHWKEVYRSYFDGGNVEMRDAGVCVREQDWDGAAELWKMVYDTRKGKAKMRAAYNLALYYEMQNEFEQAREYLDVALNLSDEDSFERQLIRAYQAQLAEEAQAFLKVKIQMNRFD